MNKLDRIMNKLLEIEKQKAIIETCESIQDFMFANEHLITKNDKVVFSTDLNLKLRRLMKDARNQITHINNSWIIHI